MTPTPKFSSNPSIGQKSKESSNELHLKLPVVTSESFNGKALDEIPQELELDKASSTDGDDDEELFCFQYLKRNRKRMSSELRDLYDVLQHLPTLSPSAYGAGRKCGNVSRERTVRWVDSTSKILSAGTKQRGNSHPAKCYQTPQPPRPSLSPDSSLSSTSLSQLNSFSTTSDCCAVCAENYAIPRREVVKMTHINLYNSILPPSLFSFSRRHAMNK